MQRKKLDELKKLIEEANKSGLVEKLIKSLVSDVDLRDMAEHIVDEHVEIGVFKPFFVAYYIDADEQGLMHVVMNPMSLGFDKNKEPDEEKVSTLCGIAYFAETKNNRPPLVVFLVSGALDSSRDDQLILACVGQTVDKRVIASSADINNNKLGEWSFGKPKKGDDRHLSLFYKGYAEASRAFDSGITNFDGMMKSVIKQKTLGD